jgi:hypothetical protein
VHFGLGAEKTIAELTVDWPSGRKQSFAGLPADRLFRITEPAAAPAATAAPAAAAATAPLFTSSDALRAFPHREQAFDDFKREPLLPNKQSRQGPGMAWGDVDGDGDDDLYLGGARGQSGRLALQAGGGRFEDKPVAAFAAHAASEDMGAVFFDVDGDGDLDLYVVSGGSETAAGDPSLQDRLYLNDGAGDFATAPAGVVPVETDSGSAVAAADADLDGDIDLFVGGRAVPGEYPRPVPSRLLRNAGGSFTAAPIEAGLVNAAMWVDLDGRGTPELVLACEWGPVRILAMRDGALTDTTEAAGLARHVGWWNGVAAVDADHDGDLDLLATNFGLNTKYKASPERPELLYYGVFDDTGRAQIVEAKFEGDALRPRRGLSCSSQAMPFIRQKLKTFDIFAQATLDQVYAPEKLRQATKLEAVTLESGVFRNDGGVFTFQPFERLAQVAPAFGVAGGDFDGDGHADAVLAQNFYHPQRETGRMNGGLGMMLKGDGKGGFTAVWPRESGLIEPGDARALAVTDANGDGAPDLVIARNDAAPSVWIHRGGSFVAVRLAGPPGNPTGLGARVTVQPEGGVPAVQEMSAGGGYLTQPGATLFFGTAGRPASVTVRWPDGTTTKTAAAPGKTVRVTSGN